MKIRLITFLLLKKKFSKIVSLILLSLALVFTLWNSLKIFSIAVDNFYDSKRNISDGLPFFFGERQNKETVISAMKLIPEGASIYFWTIPELENEISHECRAYELGYYLFPSRMIYKNSKDIIHSDFVICESCFKDLCSRKLTEIELLSSGSSFQNVFENNAIAIFAKNEKKILLNNSPESNEIFDKRISMIRISPLDILCGLTGIVILFAIGYFFLSLPIFFELRKILSFISFISLSFIMGVALIGLTFFYLSFFISVFNPLTTWLITSITIFSLIFLNWYFKDNKKIEKNIQTQKVLKEKDKITKIANFASICLLFCTAIAVSALTFSIGAYDAPGQAVWGFKTQQLIYYGGIKKDFLSDPSIMYSHPDYPPLWALLLGWFSTISTGSYNEITVKFLSLIIFFILLYSVFEIFRSLDRNSLYSSIFTTTFAGNFFLMHISSSYYAEPLLCLFILWGLYFLLKYFETETNTYFYLAFSFLGISSLIKNEGIVIFIISTILFFILSKKKYVFSIFMLILFTFTTWLIFKIFAGIKGYDFDFSIARISNENFKLNCFLSLKSLGEALFLSPVNTCSFWYLSFILILLSFSYPKKFLSKEKLFIFLLFSTYLLAITVIFGFSVRRIDWHLRVIPRLLILAQCIASLLILHLLEFLRTEKFD